MPFIQTNIEKDIELKRKNNPEFKKEWDDMQPEMDVIRAMIDARIEQNLTQKELAKRMEDVGVKTIVFTDIDQDGTLAGPNLKQLNDLAHEVSCNIIASGGVAVLKDIINLAELDVYGAICGKAIYTGSLDLKQAIEVTNKI